MNIYPCNSAYPTFAKKIHVGLSILCYIFPLKLIYASLVLMLLSCFILNLRIWLDRYASNLILGDSFRNEFEGIFFPQISSQMIFECMVL